MVKIINKKYFLKNKQEYIKKIKSGLIFIYPTDTIYGIGCDATNIKAVSRLREIKNRDKKPFSVIVPSKSWILKNCKIKQKHKKFLKKLPGKYTLILELKNNKSIAKNISYGKTIGIRIPKNWFSKFISKIKLPIVTTSANLSGQAFMTCLADLNKKIKKQVDFIIYEGKKESRPSTIINLVENNSVPKIIKR